MRSLFVIFLFLPALAVLTAKTPASLVNFSHLRHLTETIVLDGDSVDIVHVYSNAPNYEWVGAQESGMEGIACVDDAARAAVLYLRHYALTHDEVSRSRAKALLRFIRKMETSDGSFYNFVLSDHTINTTGKTSFKSFGWWACRGVWCMAAGYRIFKDVDPGFAGSLKDGIERTFPHIDSLLMKYGKTDTVKNFRTPRWLLYDSGADVTSELLLGLNEYYASTKDDRVKKFIEKLADGVMVMQDGDGAHFPFGAHRSWETMWHMWGNGQTQALAIAGKLLKNRTMLASSEREARGWYAHLMMDGFLKEIDMSDTAKKSRYEQIAYAVRPMAAGLLRLYDATGKEEYAIMAGLAGSWLFGNNVLHEPVYDSATGRCYDGIRDSATLNKNSGAESTIEALMTLVEIEHYPLAKKYLTFRKTSNDRAARAATAVFTGPSSETVMLSVDAKNGRLRVIKDKK